MQYNQGSASWNQPGSSFGSTPSADRPSVIVTQSDSSSSTNGCRIRVKSVQELMSADVCLDRPPDTSEPFRHRGPPSRVTKYKECAVLTCPNNSSTYPNELFIAIPINEPLRRKWCEAIGRQYHPLKLVNGFLAQVFVCAQHFLTRELQYSQAGNVTQVSVLQGSVPSLRLTPEAIQQVQSTRVSASEMSSKTSIKPITAVEPRCQKYEPKSMPAYPECKHKEQPHLKCTEISIVDYSLFYTKFYSAASRTEQNEIIYSHTTANDVISPDDPPSFSFFVDVQNPPGQMQVCANAFSTCLTFDITVLISLVTRLFDAKQLTAINSFVMPLSAQKPVKSEIEENVICDKSSDVISLLDSDDETEIKTEVLSPIKLEEECPVSTSELCDELTEVKKETDDFTPVSVTNNLVQYSPTRQEDPSSVDMGFFESLQICERCLSQFKSQAEIDCHLTKNTCQRYTGVYFNCNACKKQFFKFNDLKVHTGFFHRYVCPKCDETYRYRRLFENHVVKCAGTNSLSAKMVRLIESTRQLLMGETEEDAEKRTEEEAKLMTPQPIYTQACYVKLSRLKIPADFDGPFHFKTLLPIIEPKEEISEPKPPQLNPVSFFKEEPNDELDCDEIDIEDTKDFQKSESFKVNNQLANRRKRALSTDDSDQDVKDPVRTRKSGVQNPRELRRTRKQVKYEEKASDDSEDVDDPLDELEFSDDPDPTFDPLKEKRFNRLIRKEDPDSDSESQSETIVSVKKKPGQKRKIQKDDTGIECGICGSYFASIEGLRCHHRISERCSKFPPGTIFNCSSCDKTFPSQSYLDEHRSRNKDCKNSAKPSAPEHKITSESIPCKRCNVRFNSYVGLTQHLKRSPACASCPPGTNAAAGKLDGTNNGEQRDAALEKVFSCLKCYSWFSSVWGLRTHERTNDACKPENPYSIPIQISKEEAEKLKKAYVNNDLVTEERDPASPGFTYICPSCNARFTSVWGLRTHQRSSTTCGKKDEAPKIIKPAPVLRKPAPEPIKKGELRCSNCLSKFSTTWGLRTHLRNSTICGENSGESSVQDFTRASLVCPKCKKTFFEIHEFRKHFKLNAECVPPDVEITPSGRIVTGTGYFSCPQCNETYNVPAMLLQHFINHAEPRDSWPCVKCDQEFADQRTLHRHFQTNHVGTWFCTLCFHKANMATFKSFKEYYSHINEEHSTDSKQLTTQNKCTICLRSFQSEYTLEVHFVHCKKVAEQTFCCASCSKVFTKKAHISNHMKYAHEGFDIDARYNFACSDCPRKFKTTELLGQHRQEGCRIDEKTCEICGDVFIGLDKLNMHVHLAHSMTRTRPTTMVKNAPQTPSKMSSTAQTESPMSPEIKFKTELAKE